MLTRVACTSAGHCVPSEPGKTTHRYANAWPQQRAEQSGLGYGSRKEPEYPRHRRSSQRQSQRHRPNSPRLDSQRASCSITEDKEQQQRPRPIEDGCEAQEEQNGTAEESNSVGQSCSRLGAQSPSLKTCPRDHASRQGTDAPPTPTW